MLLICGGFLVLQTSQELTGNSAIAISQIALLVVVLCQLPLLLLKLNQEFAASVPVYAIQEWLGVAFIISLQSACSIILAEFFSSETCGSESVGFQGTVSMGFLKNAL